MGFGDTFVYRNRLLWLLPSSHTDLKFQKLSRSCTLTSLWGVTLKLKRNSKQAKKGCSEVLDETLENALLDYEDAAERTINGNYRCRDCGRLFDTLEQHDLHHRKVHGQVEVPLSGMPM